MNTHSRTLFPHPSTEQPAAPPARPLPQYSLRRIVGTWAAAALPMAALAWVVAPEIASSFEGPSAWPRAVILTLTMGLTWQFALVLALVRREQGSLRWSVLKDALWLHRPQSPRTGRSGGRLWWLLVPLTLAVAAKEMLPRLPMPAARDLGAFLESDAGHSFLSGNWGWFTLIITMFAMNTVLGEELLFRGLLLPRMQGVFGRGDWLANAVLFAGYHLHVPWMIPQVLVSGSLYAYPARRYRSAVMGMAVHSVQSVIFGVLVLVLVLG
jgi:membrane protease YdiL (CAAX protease family)